MKCNGKFLKKKRLEARLSREELARRIDISSSSIYNYETNKTEPSEVILKEIADVLNFDASIFLS